MKLLFDYTPSIIKLLQEISKLEGELQATKYTINEKELFASKASIEAVHYSTKIEGNALTLEQVTLALSDKSSLKIKNQRDLKEVLNYAKARNKIIHEFAKEKTITVKQVLNLHQTLLNGIVSGKLKGHFREAQNIIQDTKSKSIVYMPPQWEEVERLMHDLIVWTNQSLFADTSPLIVSALLHFQFVTIHPFMDGNGRLSRLLSNYVLYANGYTVLNYSALEKQHESDRALYYQMLRKHQAQTYYDINPDQKLNEWIEYWLRCLKSAYVEAKERLGNVSIDDQTLPERLKSALSFFRKHKKLKASDYAAIMGLGRTQAVDDLKQLVNLGYIKRVGGGRSTVYEIIEK
ncbi:Fic family protein [bacterium]|nr:Fic family protein [bacterium]